MGDQKDQETQTPSHGFDAVKWEGVRVTAEHPDGQEAGRDSRLSQRLLQVVEADELIASHKLILAVLIYNLHDKENCELRYEDLTRQTALSRRVLARYLPELEQLGWIKRTKNNHTYIYEYVR